MTTLSTFFFAAFFVIAVTMYIALPLLVLVHELGHAVTPLRAGRRVYVSVGRQPSLLAFEVGGLTLSINPLLEPVPEQRGTEDVGGFCEFNATGMTVAQCRATISAGPWAETLLAIALGLGAMAVGDVGSVAFWCLAIGSLAGLVHSALNFAPWRSQSDGWVLSQLRGHPASAVIRADSAIPAFGVRRHPPAP